jgi:hypothetical protein
VKQCYLIEEGSMGEITKQSYCSRSHKKAVKAKSLSYLALRKARKKKIKDISSWQRST